MRTLDLSPGLNGRGFTGSFDVMTQTDANGHFTIQAPALFEGYQLVRVLVVGSPDLPPQAGLSATAAPPPSTPLPAQPNVAPAPIRAPTGEELPPPIR